MSNLSKEKLEINKSVLIEYYCNQIKKKINALKLENMIEWERNHNFDSTSIDKRLKRLEEEKEQLCAMLNNNTKDTISLDLQQLLKES